jgi:hypothetical protein
MKFRGVWHHVYWGNYNFEINVTMSVGLEEPTFIPYEAMSVLCCNNGNLKQWTSKHSKNAKINIEIAYLSVWHNRPLRPKSSLYSDLVGWFERLFIAHTGISDQGTSGLAAYNMRSADFRRQVYALLCRSTATGIRSPWNKVWKR